MAVRPRIDAQSQGGVEDLQAACPCGLCRPVGVCPSSEKSRKARWEWGPSDWAPTTTTTRPGENGPVLHIRRERRLPSHPNVRSGVCARACVCVRARAIQRLFPPTFVYLVHGGHADQKGIWKIRDNGVAAGGCSRLTEDPCSIDQRSQIAGSPFSSPSLCRGKAFFFFLACLFFLLLLSFTPARLTMTS